MTLHEQSVFKQPKRGCACACLFMRLTHSALRMVCIPSAPAVPRTSQTCPNEPRSMHRSMRFSERPNQVSEHVATRHIRE